jgi:hypothetical protein
MLLTVNSFNYVPVFTVKDSTVSVRNRFGDRKLVCAVKSEGSVETAGDDTAMETADAMIKSLSLETAGEDQPSSSITTKKTFQSSRFKSGKKKRMIKKKK